MMRKDSGFAARLMPATQLLGLSLELTEIGA
jgi:hypothetical protein